MAGLLRLEQPLDLGHGFGRAVIEGLVEDQPAGDRPALFLPDGGPLLVALVLAQIAHDFGRLQQ